MELIEHIPGGLRFQRGAGVGGPLKVVWVVLTTIPIAFAVGDSAGPLAGVVVAVAGVVAASAVSWQMVNFPVRYLEVDVRGGVLRQGELRDNVRHVERELPLSVVQRFCGIDRGGPGAAYSLGAVRPGDV